MVGEIKLLFQNIPIKCNILASAAVNQSGRGHVFSLCFQEQKGADGMDGGWGWGVGEMVLGKLGPGKLGPGQLGPGQLGPGQLGPGAQLFAS